MNIGVILATGRIILEVFSVDKVYSTAFYASREKVNWVGYLSKFST